MQPLPSWQAPLLRQAAGVLSPGGARGALLVLSYHRVLPRPDPLLADEPDARAFAAQMDLVRSLFQVLPLSESIERLQRGELPPRAATITFDDGYANNLEVAAPILRERGLPATVFVTTGFIDGGRMWNDTIREAVRLAPPRWDLSEFGLGVLELGDVATRGPAVDALLERVKYRPPQERLAVANAIAERAGVPAGSGPMMTTAQLRELAGFGVEIGAHCVTHPILTTLEPDAARREIAGSRERLETLVGRPVRTFAYPNGRPGRDYAREHVEMVRDAGYLGAVSTAWGAATIASDRFQLPRVAPWDKSPLRYALRLLRSFREANAARV